MLKEMKISDAGLSSSISNLYVDTMLIRTAASYLVNVLDLASIGTQILSAQTGENGRIMVETALGRMTLDPQAVSLLHSASGGRLAAYETFVLKFLKDRSIESLKAELGKSETSVTRRSEVSRLISELGKLETLDALKGQIKLAETLLVELQTYFYGVEKGRGIFWGEEFTRSLLILGFTDIAQKLFDVVSLKGDKGGDYIFIKTEAGERHAALVDGKKSFERLGTPAAQAEIARIDRELKALESQSLEVLVSNVANADPVRDAVRLLGQTITDRGVVTDVGRFIDFLRQAFVGKQAGVYYDFFRAVDRIAESVKTTVESGNSVDLRSVEASVSVAVRDLFRLDAASLKALEPQLRQIAEALVSRDTSTFYKDVFGALDVAAFRSRISDYLLGQLSMGRGLGFEAGRASDFLSDLGQLVKVSERFSGDRAQKTLSEWRSAAMGSEQRKFIEGYDRAMDGKTVHVEGFESLIKAGRIEDAYRSYEHLFGGALAPAVQESFFRIFREVIAQLNPSLYMKVFARVEKGDSGFQMFDPRAVLTAEEMSA
ncbi:MAG TPA: hypothetical protein PLY30_03650, partial [Candidatus Omnitrophota bacterium]|nr:hypothetical protein [Candidatus Omnitrophota bacterium]